MWFWNLADEYIRDQRRIRAPFFQMCCSLNTLNGKKNAQIYTTEVKHRSPITPILADMKTEILLGHIMRSDNMAKLAVQREL